MARAIAIEAGRMNNAISAVTARHSRPACSPVRLDASGRVGHRNHFVQSNVVCQPTMENVMPEKDLHELFLDTLKDIYYAEKQILKALPKMAKAANSDLLRTAFEKHHDETEGQIERLEQVFELLGKAARGKKCDAIEGILDEGKEIMEDMPTRPHSMPACWPQLRRSSITKFPATAP